MSSVSTILDFINNCQILLIICLFEVPNQVVTLSNLTKTDLSKINNKPFVNFIF